MAFPWATIVSLAGQAIGQGLSAKNSKDEQRASDAASARRESYYRGKAAENPLSTSSAQAAMASYDRSAKQQVETARNVAAITGATPEYSLGVQKAVAEGRADLLGKIAEGASEREDRYNEMAEGARQDRENSAIERLQARKQQFANLIGNAGKSFASILSAYTSGTGSSLPESVTPAKAPAAPQNTPADTKTVVEQHVDAPQDAAYEEALKKQREAAGMPPVNFA